MRIATSIAALLATGFAFASVSAGACGGTHDARDGAELDAAVDDATRDARRPPLVDDASDLPTSPLEGWQALGAYDPYCGLYFPTEKKYLPEPIRWEPCEAAAGDAGMPGPPGLVCRRMVTDWTPDGAGQHTIGSMRSAFGPTGNLMVGIRRFVGNYIYDLVADADGPVHQAILMTGRCITGGASLSGSNVIYNVYDDHRDERLTGGAIGGRIGQLEPRVYKPAGYRPLASMSSSYIVGKSVFVEDLAPDRIYDFDTGAEKATITQQPGDSGMAYTAYQFHGDDLFFDGDSSPTTVVKVWTSGGGIKTLLGSATDTERAVSAFGTDGIDMVWLEGSGRQAGSTIYPVAEMWTAKYTTDPAVANANKRRVRSEYRWDIRPAVVGCGYAAVPTHPPSDWGKGGIRLVRLSDGVSWEIVDHSYKQGIAWRVVWPVAATCDELFAVGAAVSHFELVRIRIDSLGAGIPAD